MLTLPNLVPGNYLLSAKTTIRHLAASTYTAAACQLRSGAVTVDQSRVVVPAGVNAMTLPLQGTLSLSAPGSLTLVCAIPGGGAFASDSKLQALRVDEVTSSPDSG